MRDIKLIAFDLDGTLLNSKKELTKENYDALFKAASSGIEIVPTTGRLYKGMPGAVRGLSFVNYAITVNGAEVYDVKNDKVVATAEIELDYAIKIMEYLDSFPVIYDCYQAGGGFMTKTMQDNCEDYINSDYYKHSVRTIRKPVPELKAFLKEKGEPIQKTQLFTKDAGLKTFLLKDLAEKFPQTSVTSSTPENIEINDKNANKGHALKLLCDYLKMDIAQTMAFGDGLNDVSMIREAGMGVAMENACQEALAAADYITVSCEEIGVAKAINRLIFDD